MKRTNMKLMKVLVLLSLLAPVAAQGGVIFGNVTLLDARGQSPVGDSLRVLLVPDDGSLSAAQLANPEKADIAAAATDTTDSYAAYNIFVDGTGAYKLYLYGKNAASLLAAPLTVQIYDEPMEYILILSPAKDAAAGYKYDLRRK